MHTKRRWLVATALAATAAATLSLLAVRADPDAPPEPEAPVAVEPGPQIRGVQLDTRATATGIELRLDVAILVQAALAPREHLTVRARCVLGGEARTGYGDVAVGRLARGTSVVALQVALREPRELVVVPTSCELELGLDAAHERLARLCWDGVAMHACPASEPASGGTCAARAS